MFVHEKLQWFICPVFQVTGVFSKEYIPQGTRFGPLQGEIYTKDNVPKLANRKYFWRVRETTCFTSFFVHWRLSINQPTGKVLLKKGKVSSLNVKKRDWEETRNYYGQVFVCYSWKKKKKENRKHWLLRGRSFTSSLCPYVNRGKKCVRTDCTAAQKFWSKF